jgi:Tfp pilus assembly protein PilE
MVITLEEKIAAAFIVALLIIAAFGAYSLHLLDAGKAEEKAAVFEVEQKAEEKAQATEAAWGVKLATAQTARQGEIDAAKDAALKPFTLSVSKYTLRAAVPFNSAAPGGSASPASGGDVCSGLVPGSPGEMRSFDDAKSADQLIADYRLLFNSWPSAP